MEISPKSANLLLLIALCTQPLWHILAILGVCNLKCRPAWHIQLHQVLCSVLWGFPMLPNAHPQTVSNITVQPFTQSFHAPDFEIVYPSSDKLVEFLYLIEVTYSPASSCQLLHLRLELRCRFGVRSGFISFGK